jgi:hypothetical protein
VKGHGARLASGSRGQRKGGNLRAGKSSAAVVRALADPSARHLARGRGAPNYRPQNESATPPATLIYSEALWRGRDQTRPADHAAGRGKSARRECELFPHLHENLEPVNVAELHAGAPTNRSSTSVERSTITTSSDVETPSVVGMFGSEMTLLVMPR